MGEREISDFLSHLTVEKNVAASTQNQHVKLPLRAGSN
jgi:hypothetical protein